MTDIYSNFLELYLQIQGHERQTNKIHRNNYEVEDRSFIEWLSGPHIKLFHEIFELVELYILGDIKQNRLKFSFIDYVNQPKSKNEFLIYISLNTAYDFVPARLNANEIRFMSEELDKIFPITFCRLGGSFNLTDQQRQPESYVVFVYKICITEFSGIYFVPDEKSFQLHNEIISNFDEEISTLEDHLLLIKEKGC